MGIWAEVWEMLTYCNDKKKQMPSRLSQRFCQWFLRKLLVLSEWKTMGGAILGFCRWASLGHTGRMMLSLCKFCRTFSTDFSEPHFCFDFELNLCLVSYSWDQKPMVVWKNQNSFRVSWGTCKTCRTRRLLRTNNPDPKLTRMEQERTCFVQYQQTLSLQLITLHYAGAWVIHIRKWIPNLLSSTLWMYFWHIRLNH